MSRTSSQQRIYDQEQFTSESPTDWRQQKSISRNDSQGSLREQQQQQLRQPGAIIATTIDESSVVDVRKPSVSFKNEEYEQQQNFQPMAQQGDFMYDSGQQQQYQEPINNQPYQQQQPDYSYGTNQQYNNYEQPQQNMGALYTNSEYEQPAEQIASGKTNIEQYSESRRQSPEKEVYQQPIEQEYQSYIEPETPRRRTPPKRDSPPRQQSTEDVKGIQQRQQSRDQLYGREKTESPEETSRSPTIQQRQQSRENVQDPKSPSPTNTISPTPTKGASKAPPSPTRNRGKPGVVKGNVEQKDGRNSVGEATRSARKPDAVQKQPAKTTTSIRSKK